MSVWRRWPGWMRLAACLMVGLSLALSFRLTQVAMPRRVLLKVQTSPAGAEVWLDGQKLGNAPVEADISNRFQRTWSLERLVRAVWWKDGCIVGLSKSAHSPLGTAACADCYVRFGIWDASVRDVQAGIIKQGKPSAWMGFVTDKSHARFRARTMFDGARHIDLMLLLQTNSDILSAP